MTAKINNVTQNQSESSLSRSKAGFIWLAHFALNGLVSGEVKFTDINLVKGPKIIAYSKQGISIR